MDFFFSPRSVALIGATPNPQKGGNAILKNLISTFPGTIYPVNPNYREIEGRPCWSSVSAISDPVDLAIVFVPSGLVLPAVYDCIAKGIPGVMIQSGGFAETGPEGRARQQELKNLVNRGLVRIWGPNCMGIVDAVQGQVFSFMSPPGVAEIMIPGEVGMIVQSGMLSAGFLVDLASHEAMGISRVYSIGNKVDVNENDLLPHLLADSHTRVIALYLESFADARRFLDICRGSDKPIILLKGGKSPKGAQAALSHTASLAGDYSLLKDLLREAGVEEAHEFKQMMDIARSLARCPRGGNLEGKRGVAVLTFSGGAGIVSCDFLEENGIPLAQLSKSTEEKLKRLFPPWMPVNNPVDLWPALEKNGSEVDVYSEAVEAIAADENVSVLLIHCIAGAFRMLFDLDRLAGAAQNRGKPVFLWVMGRRDDAFFLKREAAAKGLLVFEDLYRATECLGRVFHYQPRAALPPQKETEAQTLPEIVEILGGAPGPLDEYESKLLLRQAGIPVVEEMIIAREEDLREAMDRWGFPLVMKGLAPGVAHKTEEGLVYLHLHDDRQVLAAYRSLRAKLNSQGRILLQRQLDGKRELIAGYLRDPQIGPCIMVGLGGTFANVLADRVFGMAPTTPAAAARLLDRLRSRELFSGHRGEPPVDRQELGQILATLGQLGLANPRIREIDINPLIIVSGRPRAVDATIILSGD